MFVNHFLESNITDASDEKQPLNEKKTRNSCPSDKYLEIPTRKSTPGNSSHLLFSELDNMNYRVMKLSSDSFVIRINFQIQHMREVFLSGQNGKSQQVVLQYKWN